MIPDCQRCGGKKFFNMPDSLAWACESCGFVWVRLGPDKWKPGTDIQTWLNDTYGKKEGK